MLRLYLYHCETRTLICKPRHYCTLIKAIHEFTAVEYRAVFSDLLRGLKVPHIPKGDTTVVECPEFLLEPRVLERHKQITQWVLKTDQAKDLELHMKQMRDAGIVLEDYPIIGDPNVPR